MPISYPSFDQLVTDQFPDVYHLCFLLTGEPSSAWQTAFQTFLYMGTADIGTAAAPQEPGEGQADQTSELAPEPVSTQMSGGIQEQNVLWSFCIRTCTDYYYRKLRRRPSRRRFEETAAFPVSDSLWELFCMPFQKKAAVFFTDHLGFTPERARSVISGKKAGLAPAAPSPMPSGMNGQWEEVIASIPLPEDGAQQMLSEIYLRFEERNVPLENRLRDIRYWWDHAVIWIAVAIILLFAAAAWYTSRIVVGPI